MISPKQTDLNNTEWMVKSPTDLNASVLID
jgi:hypothetical protein